MDNNNKVIVDTKGLENLNKFVKNGNIVKIGILDNGGDHDGMNNATLGLIHEFGSLTKKIPARSFLRMPLEEKGRDIEKEMSKSKRKIEDGIAKGDKDVGMKLLGIIGEKFIQEAFETRGFGKWSPNKARTIRRKGSDSPLIDTGELRKSITSKVGKANG